MKKSKGRWGLWVIIIILVIIILMGAAYIIGTMSSHNAKPKEIRKEVVVKKDKKNSKKDSSESKQESSKPDEGTSNNANETASNNKSSSDSSTKDTNNAPITLSEAEQLVNKVDGEWPQDAKVTSNNGNTTTVSGYAGAKGEDHLTFTTDGNNVKIHEEFGTLDGGSYKPLDDMPPRNYSTTR